MITLVRIGGRSRWAGLAAGFAAWVLAATPGQAQYQAVPPPPSLPGAAQFQTVPPPPSTVPGHVQPLYAKEKHPGPGVGTLGYGKPGLYPGFQGFGLGYHLGYGYGGQALGVGSQGGFPYYGGPGYPHPWPALKRFGGINPFPYFGGPGYPTASCPNFYGGTGQLVADPPVIVIEPEPGEADYSSGFGAFTGALPYPENAFAPYTTTAGTVGSSSGVSSESAPNAPPNLTPEPGEAVDEFDLARYLGAPVQAVGRGGGTRGLRLERIQPGGIGEKAGLRAGDVIASVNGYVTESPANLAWIITNAAPDRVLNLSVRGTDGVVRVVTIRLP